MRHPPSRVTAMTLITDGNEDFQDIMSENLCELPRTSDFYPYIDANSSPLFGGYPATHSSTRGKRRRSRDSFSSSQPVPLLTLPRVVLWCRDGVCYPYYKKPTKNGKLGPQIPDPRYSFTNSGFNGDDHQDMPTIITMKSPENLQPLNPSSLNNMPPKENLVSTNINNANKISDFKIHKHTINVKNIPASSINGSNKGSGTTSSSSSSAKSDHNYQISTITSTIPHSISTYPDRVTLTINSATASSSDNDTAHPSKSLPASTDFHNNHSNHQLIRKSEKNVSRCSLGPTTGGSTDNNNTCLRNNYHHHGGDSHKNTVTDAELDEVLSFPSNLPSVTNSNGNNNNHNSKITTAQVFANSISKPNPFCPSCNGIVPLNHMETTDLSTKIEPGFWNSNNFHTNLHREASFHSYGGFTLNGQAGHISAKKHKMRRFCSSHKVAFVVSTFSLIVTIGLVITLLLMKKKGMMEAMR